MVYLLITTFIWAFSFSIIGHYLSPDINPWTLSLLRTVIALIIFLPIIDLKIPRKHMLIMGLIGAIQIGVMYLLYLNAFLFISVSKILLFTITTPLYVTIVSDIIDQRIRSLFLMLSIGSILGALLIRFTLIGSKDIVGLFLIQGANLCFATGQVLYKNFIKNSKRSSRGMSDFAYFYFGALVITIIGFMLSNSNITLPISSFQWILIIWLGAIASGLGFYLWNRGALLVSSGTLAVMNNLVIPLGLIIEIIVFSKVINIETFLIGTIIIFGTIIISLKISN
ncbi:MAG: EamA family transporter [Candidatus Marinimicrobia bacterium]|nr:EamA family transporter [Candidatus Neomarinimicrobiota bacterium]